MLSAGAYREITFLATRFFKVLNLENLFHYNLQILKLYEYKYTLTV